MPASYTMSYRTLTSTDEPILWIMLYLAIHVSEGQEALPMNIIFRPELAHYVRGWGRPGDLALGAFDAEGLPGGAAWLRCWQPGDRGYGWVRDDIPELSIAVLPQYRGQRIGAQLMDDILAQAAARYPAVSLSVSRGNRAIHLYQRHGFQILSEDAESILMLHPF